jgi:hypothetical protein
VNGRHYALLFVFIAVIVLILLYVASQEGSPDDTAAGPVTPMTAMRLRSIDDDEIKCGPFVDGTPRPGETFTTGRWAGQTCTDPLGCGV